MTDIVWSGVSAFGLAINHINRRVEMENAAAVAEGAERLRAVARQRTKQGKTGRARAGIGVEGPFRSGDAWSALIGTTTPYGRRLWLGFHGTDSIGRKFNQRGRNALAAARRAVKPQLSEIAAEHWRKGITG